MRSGRGPSLAGRTGTNLGASRAWIPPVLWATTASEILERLSPTPHPPGYVQALTWPVQPAESGPAMITAVVLGVLGTGAYVALGPQP